MPFTSFPVLHTERLTLRQLSPDDAQGIFDLRSNPDINQYLDRNPATHLDDAQIFIEKITSAIQNKEAFYWAVVLTENHTFAGTICLFGFSDQLQKCEIGFELLPAFQGKGIMKEAAGKVLEYATQTLKMAIIEGFARKDNHPSIQLLMRLGFRPSPAAEYTQPDNPTEEDASQILSLFVLSNAEAGAIS